jgi:hypothetical protein
MKVLIERGRSDQDHFQVERNRLRTRPNRRERRHLFARVLDPHLAGDQGTLQAFPGKGAEDDVEGVQNQEAAVRAVQRARLDLQEVGHHRSHHGAVFLPADQVVVSGVALANDRRAGHPAIVDQHIDFVSREALLPLPRPVRSRPRRLGFGRRPEVAEMFRQVLFDLLDESEDTGLIAVVFQQLRDERACRYLRHCSIQRHEALFCGLLVLPHLTHETADLGLNFLAALLHLRLFLWRQLLEYLRRHGLAILQRDRANSGPRCVHREPALQRKGAQVCDQPGTARAHLGEGLLSSLRIVLALEGARNFPLRRFQK